MTLKDIIELLDLIVECKVCRKGFKSFDGTVGVPLIQRLYSRLTSKEVKWITRIILKDLRLRIEPKVVFDSFHGWMWRIYNMKNDLKLACKLTMDLIGKGYTSAGKLSDQEFQKVSREFFGISLGTNVAIMACGRAQGVQHVVERLYGHECFVEQKYDGERLQAHMCKLWPERIRIFSKSGRDSTKDRYRCHDQLLRALKFTDPNNTIESCIVEGELLVYNEKTKQIENFGTVQDLQAHKRWYQGDIVSGDRHYIVILFDLLFLNGQDLTCKPLEFRRSLLETLVSSEPNYVKMTAVTRVSFSSDSGVKTLQAIYADAMLKRMEGLIIKKASAPYIPGNRSEWLKLKKDYIEGFGDTAEFAVVGVVHNPEDNGRLTRFIIGCLTNKEEMQKDESLSPNFIIVFTVHQGLNEEESNIFHERVKSLGLIPFSDAKQDLRPQFAAGFRCDVDFILETPILVELLGSGFVKERAQPHYVLRFPRIRRVFFNCSVLESVSFQELQEMAQNSFTSGNVAEHSELIEKLGAHTAAQKDLGSRAPLAVRPNRLVLSDDEETCETPSKIIKAVSLMETPADHVQRLRAHYFFHITSEHLQCRELVQRIEREGFETLNHLIAVANCENRQCIVVLKEEEERSRIRQSLKYVEYDWSKF